jgi:hypothetical protein
MLSARWSFAGVVTASPVASVFAFLRLRGFFDSASAEASSSPRTPSDDVSSPS